MKTQKLEQDCWLLIFELWVKMIITEKCEPHHVNDNVVKDTLTGKIITGKHLHENKLKKNQARFSEQLNKTCKMKNGI